MLSYPKLLQQNKVTYLKFSKTTQNCQNYPKLSKNSQNSQIPNISKTAQNCPKLLKIAQNYNKFYFQVARLRKHSLQVAPESVYPTSSRRGSYRFLRASYTAGSMAGLGFSMVILGICIGIFLGFLLWKRRLGVIPYYLNP